MNTQWLKVKTAGLPRWAWLVMFGGAAAIGLYLRSQSDSEPETPEEEEEESPGGLESFDGTETGASLGSAGIAGPAGGSVVPVEVPQIPEGLLDAITGGQQANVEAQQIIGDLAQAALAREPNERTEVITTVEPRESAPPPDPRNGRESKEGIKQHPTGGGAPKRKPHHKPPKKHQPKPRVPKPKQGKPKPKRQPKRQPKPKPRQRQQVQRGGAGGHRAPVHHAPAHRQQGHRAR